MSIEQQIKELESKKDSVNEQLLVWKNLSIVTIVRLKREREAIQEKLDQLYQQLD